ncbi:hypothetical protein [Singulisphaera sp. PoT]|uniref:hypothetical protein n=1 Tax=Singulisphaera sp. PoT TaxID=3411797 RepID=UPI003BF49209
MGRPAKPWQRKGKGQWFATVGGRKETKIGTPETVRTRKQANLEFAILQAEARKDAARSFGGPAPRDAPLKPRPMDISELPALRDQWPKRPPLSESGEHKFESFKDKYNDLFIAPFHPGEANCPERSWSLLDDITITLAPSEPFLNGFDCSWYEWRFLFAEEVYEAEKRGWPGEADPEAILTPQYRALANLADRTDTPIELDDDYRVEKSEGAWILRRGRQEFLAELEGPWFGSYRFSDERPQPFRDPYDAVAACVLIQAIYKCREIRYEAALKVLESHRNLMKDQDKAAKK